MSLVVNHVAPAINESAHQIINPEGKVVGPLPDLSGEQFIQFYHWMVFGRFISDRMVALQRQGRMGTFAQLNGQEAANVGMAAPLQPEDWLLGSYREFLGYHVKGVPFFAQLKQWGGDIADAHPFEARCIPFQIVLSTQVLHAVGIAQAAKYSSQPHVAVVGCGDGATSEGDFNEALNFAGVFKAPVIFVVQNNGWAISTPREKQTAAATIAGRGPGFGVPACLVDGNDVLAMYQTVADAAERARAGQGATLIEALTYRMGAHTTADDPTKYRPEEELEEWARRDPITRYRKFLIEHNMLTEAQEQQILRDVEAEFEDALADYESLPARHPDQHFQHIFAQMTPQLGRQQEQLLKDLGL